MRRARRMGHLGGGRERSQCRALHGKNKGTSRGKASIAGQAKAYVIEKANDADPRPDGGAEPHGKAAPAAPADDTAGRDAGTPSTTVAWGAYIVRMKTILQPAGHQTNHVMQAESIRLEAPNGPGAIKFTRIAAHLCIQVHIVRVIAPEVG